MQETSEEIAHTAARLVVEEGLAFGPAKQRALKALGLPRAELPSNETLELAVREYVALYCADTQPGELLVLRRLALVWMQRMAAFNPHLAGAVWHGWATRLSDIDLQLFAGDSKAAEIALIDRNVRYQPRTVSGMQGRSIDCLSISAESRELACHVGVHLHIYDLDDFRGALKPDAQGRKPRGNIAAVQLLIEAASS